MCVVPPLQTKQILKYTRTIWCPHIELACRSIEGYAYDFEMKEVLVTNERLPWCSECVAPHKRKNERFYSKFYTKNEKHICHLDFSSAITIINNYSVLLSTKAMLFPDVSREEVAREFSYEPQSLLKKSRKELWLRGPSFVYMKPRPWLHAACFTYYQHYVLWGMTSRRAENLFLFGLYGLQNSFHPSRTGTHEAVCKRSGNTKK